MDQGLRPERILIVTVHGTGDGDREQNQDTQWWRASSDFCQRLRAAVKERTGSEPHIHPVTWTGANNALDREAAAYKLTGELKRLAGDFDQVHVVAHSHGGNAATDAALMLGWGAKRPACRLTSITTVGTPFLRNEESRLRKLGAYAFWAAAGLQFLLGAGLVIAACMSSPFNPVLLLAGAGTIAFAWLFMAPEAARGIRRIRRDGARRNTSVQVYSIRHDNDEAIEALRTVLAYPIEPFRRGALLRSATANGVAAGVWTMVVATAALLVYSLAIAFRWLPAAAEGEGFLSGLHHFWATQIIGNADTVVEIVIVVLLHALFSGSIFAIFFIALAGLAAFADVFLRGLANASIADTLRGMALGSTGDQKPAFVDSDSHAFGALPGPLPAAVSERMRQEARENSDKFLEAYRWELLMAGAKQVEIINRMMADPLTWKGLVHNRYFYQPEIVGMVADHIAAAARVGAVAKREG